MPTFSGQYLNFNTENTVSHKNAVAQILVQRTSTYCSNDKIIHLEKEFFFYRFELGYSIPGMTNQWCAYQSGAYDNFSGK